MPLTAKGEKIKSAMQEQYGEEKGTSVFYASRNKGTIEGVDQMPQMPTTPPNSSIPSSPTGAMGTTSPPVTGDDSETAEGPKGVVKPLAGLPEDKIKSNNPGGPSGTPDAWSPEAREAAAKARKGIAGGEHEAGEMGRERKMQAKEAKAGPYTPPKEGAETATSRYRGGMWVKKGGPADVDHVGRRKLANDRPPDKAVGTLRDYAAAAGAKRQ
jgi:hypothetical protein